jgi:DNA-binding CsgD family transcriptional regulator
VRQRRRAVWPPGLSLPRGTPLGEIQRAIPVSDHLRDLAEAETPAAIYERLVSRVRELLSVSGVHVMPLARGPSESLRPVLHLRDDDPNTFGVGVARAVQALQAEPELPDLFAQPRRVMRVEEVFGWERWLRSPTYQEHFRPTSSARQLVVGFTDASGAPRGFMAVCRSEQDAVISAREEELVLELRDQAERALEAFPMRAGVPRLMDDILSALTTSLPIPALLIDAAGKVVWLNHEAELRLGAVTLQFGAQRFYAGASSALRELLAHARRELSNPGTLLSSEGASSAPRWLLRGESVIVRRLERPGMPLHALVCLSAPPQTVEREPCTARFRSAFGFSARETDVAALAMEGYSVLAIAHQLGIAESTVATHLKRVYRKLGVSSRAELALKLLRV